MHTNIAQPNRPRVLTNRAEAEAFIAALTGSPDAVCDFATFADSKSSAAALAYPPLRVRGTLDQAWDQLSAASAAGHGVFMTINASNGQSFRDADIVDLRAVFVDDDKADPPATFESLQAIGVRPSLTVQSGSGEHNYWVLQKGEDVSDFTPCQKALAKKFGTDPAVSNVGRVMRLPGFLHLKDPSDPFMVAILQCSDRRFSVREIVVAYKLPTTPEACAGPFPPADGRPSTVGSSQGTHFAGITQPTYAPREQRKTRARAYLGSVPPAIQGNGGDSATMHAAMTTVVDFDLDDEDAEDVLQDWNARCVPPWEPRDLMTKIRNARRYAKGAFGSKCGAEERRPPPRTDAPAETAAPGDEVAGYAPWPSWTADQFGADKGPLVNYKLPDSKKKAEIDEASDEAARAQERAESQDASAKAKTRNKWIQTQPSSDQIADAVPLLVKYVRTIVVESSQGNELFRIGPDNIARPVKPEALRADVFTLCRAMMAGKNPSLETVNSAYGLILCNPLTEHTIKPLRWEGERFLALHELRRPVDGDWSAWREFIDRCSCPDTAMAWTWTCYLPPEEYQGRESLIFQGSGNDGKSYYCDAITRSLGPVATAADLPRDDQRFQLALLKNKRLAYFGDIQNPFFMRGKTVREIMSGAHLAYERKGRDIESAWFYVRCLFSMNPFPKMLINDRAERSRVRLVTVKELPPEMQGGDSKWPSKLQAQLPAFLFECQKAFARLMSGRPIGAGLPETSACAKALEGGMQAIEEDFEFITSRYDFTGHAEDTVNARELGDQIAVSKCKPSEVYRWLTSRGCDRALKKINGKPVRVWKCMKKIG